jgi:MFS family permease
MIVPASTAQRRGWYHGWNIVAVCVLSSAVANGLPVNAFSLFLQDWSAQLHAPISFFQLGLAALGLFSAFCAPYVGVLSDKYPARWLMGGGLLGMALLCIGVSMVRTSWQLLALFMIVLPLAVVFSTTLPQNAVVSRWFVRRLGLALGLTSFGLGISGVALPPIVAALLPAFGWRTIWRVAGIFIALVVAPLVVWVVRDRPATRDGMDYVAADGASGTRDGHGHGAGPGSDGLNWRTVFGRRNFWLLVVVFLPMLGLYGGSLNNLAPIASTEGLSRQTAGALMSALSFAHICSTLICGLLSDRFGNRLPLAGLALATGIGGLMLALGHGTANLGVAVVLIGLSGGMWPLLAAAVATEFGAGGVGRAFGLLMMFLPVIVLVPFTVAKIHEVFGSYAPSLIGLSVLTIAAGTACLLLMREGRGGRGRNAAEETGTTEVVPSTV